MKNEIIWEDAAKICEKINFKSLDGATVLITGASGMIGTYLLATLTLLKESGKNIRVYGMCRSVPRHTLNIMTRSRDQILLTSAVPFERPDVIIHAAGYASPRSFLLDEAETIYVNTALTQELLSKLDPQGKFLFLSSSEVYSGWGYKECQVRPCESDIGTTTPYHPRACYIEGKRCGETLVNAYRSHANAKSARLAMTYGPGTRRGDKRSWCSFIEGALIQKRIALQFPGRETRVMCYIRDAVEMLWNVCLRGKEPVYNVTGFAPSVSMAYVAKTISEVTGASLHIPDGNELQGAPDDVRISNSRIYNEFGKTDFVPLEEGLRRTIDWQRELYK
jgi:UDP-glucuronate decarboxylase